MIYLGGTFDLMHPGHVRAFQLASLHGSLVVALNTDEFAERYKRRPILTLEERMEVVASCKFVDHVVVNVGDEDSRITIEALLKNCLPIQRVAYSTGWPQEQWESQTKINPAWLAEHGLELVPIPYDFTISTSEVIKRCQQSS